MAKPAQANTILTEAGGTLVPTEDPSVYLLQIISAGPGSSGIYPPAALEAAATAKVFHKGLHMYMDHPTQRQTNESRGVRSVRDLVSVLQEDATWDPARQALLAPTKVVRRYRDLIADVKEDVGVSIRAICAGGPGEWNGHKGIVVSEFVKALSVDWVSAAGARGKVLEVLEGATADGGVLSAGEVWQFPDGRIVAEAASVDELAGQLGATRLPLEEATSSQRREQLQRIVAKAWEIVDEDNRTHWSYVRDYDEVARLLWFENDDSLWQQAWATDSFDQPLLVGDRIEVQAVTKYVPVNTASQATEQEENKMPELSQERLDELLAAEGRAKELAPQLEEATKRADTAEATAKTAREEALATVIEAKLDKSKLTDEGKTRVKATIALLGEAATPEKVTELVTAEEAYAASLTKGAAPRRVGFGANAGEVQESAKPLIYTNAYGREITIGG